MLTFPNKAGSLWFLWIRKTLQTFLAFPYFTLLFLAFLTFLTKPFLWNPCFACIGDYLSHLPLLSLLFHTLQNILLIILTKKTVWNSHFMDILYKLSYFFFYLFSVIILTFLILHSVWIQQLLPIWNNFPWFFTKSKVYPFWLLTLSSWQLNVRDHRPSTFNSTGKC